MPRYSTYFDNSNKEYISSISKSADSDDILSQLKGVKNYDISPILREQRRRSSGSGSGSLTANNSKKPDIFGSGIVVPNSVVRKSITDSSENQLIKVDNLKRLSNEEIVEKILNRLKKEKVDIDLNQMGLQKNAMNFIILTPGMKVDEDKKRSKKKKTVDKDKEIERALRRTSIGTPFTKGRLSTSDAIKEAIEKSEKKDAILVEPEILINQSNPNVDNNPVPLTHSMIKDISESLIASSKRISELTIKMEAQKNSPVSKKKPKENENMSQVQVNSAPTSPKKKDKSAIKKKSSLKLSKLGSSSYVHPTIHEVDEGPTSLRSESRQTQLSSSSSIRGTSVRSYNSLHKRSSSASDSIRRVPSGNTKPAKKDSGKQLTSVSKEKTSRVSISSRSSITAKETDDNLSRRSNTSQKSSERLSSTTVLKHKKSSLKSISSKQKVEGQVSRTSSKAGSVSSDDTVSTIDDQYNRKSLSSLIDMYYSNPNRQSTVESLHVYMKSLVNRKDSKHTKAKKQETKSEIYDTEDQPGETNESDSQIVKREEISDDELSQIDKRDDSLANEEESMKNLSPKSKGFIDNIYSESFNRLISEVTGDLKSSPNESRKKSLSLAGKQKRGSGTDKRSSVEQKLQINSKSKTKGSITVKRDSKEVNNKNENIGSKNETLRRSSKLLKIGVQKPKEEQSNRPVLEKRKTLETDSETIRYLTSKKIISLSTMRAVRMKNKG